MYTWALVFISDASTTQARLRLKRPERRNKDVRKRTHKDQFSLFSSTCDLFLCLRCSKWKKKLRHNTSTSIFTKRGYVWQMKTADLDYLARCSNWRKIRWFAVVCVEFRFDLTTWVRFVTRNKGNSRSLFTGYPPYWLSFYKLAKTLI